MRLRHLRMGGLAAITVGVFLLFESTGMEGARAQLTPVPLQNEPGTSAEATAPESPLPIPGASVSIKAEETSTLLLSMRDRHLPDKEIEEIRSALPEALGRYDELLEQTEKRASASISGREYEQLHGRWMRAQRAIGDWQRKVQRRTHSLDRDLQTLQELQAQWDLTIETADATGLNEALVGIARNSREAVRQVEARFGERRAELQTVEEQIRRAEDRIREAQALLDEITRSAGQRFATRDAPPVWTILAHPPPRVRQLEQLKVIWEEGQNDLREFLASDGEYLFFFAVVAIALTMGLVLLSRWARTHLQKVPEFEESSRVLSRPFSGALIAVLLVLVLALPEAPSIIDDAAALVLFIPLFRVLPNRPMAGRKGLLAALVVVNVLGRLAEILMHRSPLQRAVLLVSALIVCVVVLRLLRTRQGNHEASLSHFRTHRILRGLEWITFLIAGVAVVANLLGYVTLTTTLVRAVSLSAYLALAVYAVYLMFEGILPILLKTALSQRFTVVRLHAPILLQRSLWVLRLGLILLWFEETLGLLQLRHGFLSLLGRILTTDVHFGELGFSLGDILSFGITVWAAFAFSRLVRVVLAEDVYPRLALPRGVPNAISTAIHYFLLLLGFFLAMAATGIDLGRFAILAGAFGLGVGFGLQNIINNFVSGLILIVERPIMPGDTVQIGELAGEVKRIGMRSSTVRTWQGAEVIVPNGNLISNEVINWTLSDPLRRLDIKVGVAYGTDPQRTLDLLVKVAEQHPDVIAQPEPVALFVGFGDSSLDFELRFWTSRLKNFLGLKSEVTLAVHRALQDAEISIPFPQRDLHLKSLDPGLRQTLGRSPTHSATDSVQDSS